MKHVLILVQQPDRTNIYKYGSWVEYTKKIEQLTTLNKDVQLLAQNVILFLLRDALGVLPSVLQTTAEVEYSYRVFDSEDDKWHEGPMATGTQNL